MLSKELVPVKVKSKRLKYQKSELSVRQNVFVMDDQTVVYSTLEHRQMKEKTLTKYLRITATDFSLDLNSF